MKGILLAVMKALMHQKKININFNKANTKCCLNVHYNADNSYFSINGKVIIKFKTNNKNVNFPTEFYLEGTSNRLIATESRDVFLNENVFDILVAYISIDKYDILNI